jgi:hypothetical protein
MAHEFETAGHSWSLGITPKYQRIDLFNYSATVNDFDKNDMNSTITTTPKPDLTPTSVWQQTSETTGCWVWRCRTSSPALLTLKK